MSIFCGFDGEMSGADLEGGCALIQIGAAIRIDGQVQTFCSDISPTPGPPGWWQPKAAQVHGLTLERLAAAPTASQVDDQLYDWLVAAGADPSRRARLLPVGFNVMAFDMPFVKKFLPRSYSLFSRRGIDLNALCFALAQADQSSSARSADGYKRLMKQTVDPVVSQLNDQGPHNAGFDAAQALLGFEWISNGLTFDPERIPRLDPLKVAPTSAKKPSASAPLTR